MKYHLLFLTAFFMITSTAITQEKDSYQNTPPHTFHLKIEATGIDSILKDIPLPKSIEISGERIRISNSEFFPLQLQRHLKKTERQRIVKFGSDVIVGRNEGIDGDVVVFGGNATIYGTVKGGVVVVKGNIRLASTSYIQNDVVCIWGHTDVDRGARIGGETTVFNFGKLFHRTPNRKIFYGASRIFRFFRVIILFFLVLLIYYAFPAQTKRICNRLHNEYPKTLATGSIGFLLLPAIFVILLATIIGIPVAILLFPIAIIGAFLMGGTAFSLFLGQTIKTKTGLNTTSPPLLLGIGILILELPSLLSKTIFFFVPLFSTTLILISILIFFAAWIPAFGAVILTRFGTRP